MKHSHLAWLSGVCIFILVSWIGLNPWQPAFMARANLSDPAAIQNILDHIPPDQMEKRIDSISAYFLGRPYRFGPLGEGPQGVYDQDPLYCYDYFDCLTFVETVMACALSRNTTEMELLLNQIRYANGQISFGTRNHFTELDWIPNNQKQGWIQDINAIIAGNQALSIAEAVIDKQVWYACRTLEDLQLPGLPQAELSERLLALQAEGKIYSPVQVRLPYLPLKAIFRPISGQSQVHMDHQITDRIPTGAIVCIVRPNWFLPQIGTPIHISHLGFAIWQGPQLYFRHATSAGTKQVMDVLLEDYLRAYLTSPEVKGIVVLKIFPRANDRVHAIKNLPD